MSDTIVNRVKESAERLLEQPVTVTVQKLTGANALEQHVMNGHFVAECRLENGELVAKVDHWNKDKALLGLIRGVEAAFSRSLYKM